MPHFSRRIKPMCIPHRKPCGKTLKTQSKASITHDPERKGAIVETSSSKVIGEATELVSLEGLEREFAKDRWGARNIPGLRFAAPTDCHYIRFTASRAISSPRERLCQIPTRYGTSITNA